jgi:hypothetical protein
VEQRRIYGSEEELKIINILLENIYSIAKFKKKGKMNKKRENIS